MLLATCTALGAHERSFLNHGVRESHRLLHANAPRKVKGFCKAPIVTVHLTFDARERETEGERHKERDRDIERQKDT